MDVRIAAIQSLIVQKNPNFCLSLSVVPATVENKEWKAIGPSDNIYIPHFDLYLRDKVLLTTSFITLHDLLARRLSKDLLSLELLKIENNGKDLQLSARFTSVYISDVIHSLYMVDLRYSMREDDQLRNVLNVFAYALTAINGKFTHYIL